MVHPIQIADLAYLPVPADDIALVIANSAEWPRWFPNLRLTVTENRGPLGLRWTATGAVDGTSEIWLESVAEGTNLHYFLHAAPSGTGSPATQAKRAASLTTFYRFRFKDLVNELRQLLDSDRPAGEDPLQWRVEHPRAREIHEELPAS